LAQRNLPLAVRRAFHLIQRPSEQVLSEKWDDL
jgi:hypothetical protein